MVDVIPTLQSLKPGDLAGRTAVVVDVLRATSTIVAALAAGAREIRPTSTPREARARLARLAEAGGSREGLLLGGERLGLRIEGFDLGNSPLEYTPGNVAGRTILFCTTNGTRTLRRAAGRGPSPAARVLVAAFLNATAVAERLLDATGSITIVCAGTRGGFSLEDVLLAGLLVDHLQQDQEAADQGGRGHDPRAYIFRDLARAAAVLYRSSAGEGGADLARVIVSADHARYLSGLGFGADVAYCASRDVTDIVPEFRGGRVAVTT